MAYRSGNGKKIILLLLIIIVIIGGGILLIDFVGSIVGVYFPLPGLKQIKQFTQRKKIKIAEDPYLLEREELEKDIERLKIMEEQIETKENEINAKEDEANKKLELLKEKENELIKKENIINDRENQYNDKEENIREQAVKLYNMPPKDAVKLLGEQEEADIVSILRAIDRYSEEIGRQSTSPYLLKLLGDTNKEKAASVLRKLKYSADDKKTAVEELDESELKELENF